MATKKVNMEIEYDEDTGQVTHMRVAGDFDEASIQEIFSNPDNREIPLEMFSNNAIHIMIGYRRMSLDEVTSAHVVDAKRMH